MNPPLATLRAELDSIDDALHDLLMRRAAIVGQVAARKRADGETMGLRPGREAAMVRRLLARHQGALPPESLVRVWREVLAGSVALQGSFVVAVGPGQHLPGLARAHFGVGAPLRVHATNAAALDDLRAGHAAVVVLDHADAVDWAAGLDGLHVTALLPFWRVAAAAQQALVVAAAPPDPSGDDISLIFMPIAEGERWTLVEQDGLLSPADERLPGGACLLGGYARPVCGTELGQGVDA